MKKNIAVGLLGVALAATAQAGIYTVYSTGGPYEIPEGTPPGLSPLSLSVPGDLGIVEDVNVWLNLGPLGNQGSMWNGDIIASLTHPATSTGMSVGLLNRIGTDPTHSLGFNDSGLEIWLDDEAVSGNVHTAGGTYAAGSLVTGTFMPDASSPGLALFDNKDMSGLWVLNIYDASTGNRAQVNQWGLKITYRDVPDSSLGGVGFSAILFGGLLALARRHSWVHGN